jgi:LCP family protein required for cell wall assembly
MAGQPTLAPKGDQLPPNIPSSSPPDDYQRALRRRHRRKVALVVAAVLVVLVAAVGAALYAVTESLGNNVRRVAGVFTPIPAETRPVPTGQLTFLLVGRDSGVVPAPADVFMLATANQARTAASLVAIPPDAVVDMPGHGRQRLDAAEALGGPALAVQTVEQLTGVHVDHYAVIDFGQLAGTVDLMAGIDVGIAQASTTPQGVSFVQGTNHLDGVATLAYLRQPDLPRGESDRAARQQAVMRGMLYQAIARGYGGPLGLYELADSASGAVAVDDTLSNNDLRWLVFDMRGMRAGETVFLSAPIAGPAEGGGVTIDPGRAAELWQAVRTDAVAGYGDRYPTDVLGGWAP